MRVEIVQGGRVLRQIPFDGRIFVEAPPEGEYSIRLTNDSWSSRRMAVVSVDGVNVINGKDGSVEGPGYVLRSGESVDIKGWRRTDSEVATFTFKPIGDSYANQVGKGVSNVGVIGVAVFDEHVKKYSGFGMATTSFNSPHTMDSMPIGASANSLGSTANGSVGSRGSTASGKSILRRRRVQKKSTPKKSLDVGTGYGKKATMHTQETTFKRASEVPAQVIRLQYATRGRLEEWGVPLLPPEPNPFPGDEAAVPAPPGWRG